MNPAQQQQPPRNPPPAPLGGGRGGGVPVLIREQDHMPITNIIRIMRRVLPPHAKISDDAKETIQQCVSEYISFITGEANEHCQHQQRKTVTADDVLFAMQKLGFDNYLEPLSLYLARYREREGDRAYRDPRLLLNRSGAGHQDVGPTLVPLAPLAPAPAPPPQPPQPTMSFVPLAPAPGPPPQPQQQQGLNSNFQMQLGDGYDNMNQLGMYDGGEASSSSAGLLNGYYGLDPFFFDFGSGQGSNVEDIEGTSTDENGLIDFDELYSQLK
uniref:Putative transcription factor H2A superfamily protein n=1 Tax=Linum usitatissimum TaxID=4006 RepID=F6LC74_LINUS|nr:putative transcription factor H2A superfamily protein [Linum usitatissimum]